MKAPLPSWLKWVMRIAGVALVLGSALTFREIWHGITAVRQGFAATKPLSNEALTQLLIPLAANLAIAIAVISLGIWLFRRAGKRDLVEELAEAPTVSAPVPKISGSATKAWSLCNVLEVGVNARRIWQFDAHNGGSFNLNREQTSRPGEPLPVKLIGKSWSSLWQKKANVAWLPPENVFIRVAQFPQSSPDETRAMVELQLEKLSPIPMTQAVWTMQVLPNSDKMQTIVVTIVSRSVVEEFLGELEGQGYLADRLEVPLLDQLQATPITEDGAWIYPEVQGGVNTALVAWWYGGVLQNVDLLTLPAEADRAAGLKDQLMQMAWAGELEGWLTAPPRWHLVADEAMASEWVTPLQEGLEQLIEVLPPMSRPELAARTARRAVQADPRVNLLPPEFGVRYQRQFWDRLWMRGLGAALGLYVAGLIVYFIALAFLNYKTNAAEADVKMQAPGYTNAIHLKSQYQILKERVDLQFAALDCWEAVAETLPENVTLESINFSDGRKLSLRGTAPSGQVNEVIDFSDKLRKHLKNGQPLFNLSNELPSTQVMPGGTIQWSYTLELRRTERR